MSRSQALNYKPFGRTICLQIQETVGYAETLENSY